MAPRQQGGCKNDTIALVKALALMGIVVTNLFCRVKRNEADRRIRSVSEVDMFTHNHTILN